MMRWVKLLIISTMALLLSGCGFHLREHLDFPKQLQSIYISSAAPYGQFEQYLKTILRDSNINVVTDAEQSPYMLRLDKHFVTQTVSGISANTQTRSFNLTYQVSYTLLYKKTIILPSEGVTVGDSYISSASQLSSSMDAQLRNTITELQHAAASQIINRLSSTDVKKRLNRLEHTRAQHHTKKSSQHIVRKTA